jgi:hypothetical protein
LKYGNEKYFTVVAHVMKQVLEIFYVYVLFFGSEDCSKEECEAIDTTFRSSKRKSLRM